MSLLFSKFINVGIISRDLLVKPMMQACGFLKREGKLDFFSNGTKFWKKEFYKLSLACPFTIVGGDVRRRT